MGIDRLRLLLEAGRPDLIRDLRDLAKLADVMALVLHAAQQGLIDGVVDDRLRAYGVLAMTYQRPA